jgi:hypothetical protein
MILDLVDDRARVGGVTDIPGDGEDRHAAMREVIPEPHERVCVMAPRAT